ncbi:ubiquitin-protein ligase peroxin 12 [Borealophlyctis nickersoniae]|nr:ubiquitin-protein ligase peroxin 12 [Borealophlyctis nickersoniae]
MEFLSSIGAASDPYRPSVFELVAQDKMRELLQPALRYVLTVYAQRYPRYLLRLVNRHEELYAVIMLLIEGHYLKEWNASFAENFYGLKRVPANQPSRRKVKGMSPSQARWSLFFLVGLPYVKCKMDEAYEKVSGGPGGHIFGSLFANEEDQARPDEPLSAKLKRGGKHAFRVAYPYLHALYQALVFLHQIGYIYGKTEYYSPWLRLSGLTLRRMSQKDFKAHADRQQAARQAQSAALQNLSSAGKLRYLLRIALSRGFDFLKYALPMSIFFFKFLEWWYSSEYHKQVGTQPIPPPPEPLKLELMLSTFDSRTRKGFLCRKTFRFVPFAFRNEQIRPWFPPATSFATRAFSNMCPNMGNAQSLCYLQMQKVYAKYIPSHESKDFSGFICFPKTCVQYDANEES